VRGLEIPQLGEVPDDLAASWNHHVSRALDDTLYSSPSHLALLPIQDLFDLRDRINTPNTVGPQNWSWRLPWSLETIDAEDFLGAQLDAFAGLARRTGRIPG